MKREMIRFSAAMFCAIALNGLTPSSAQAQLNVNVNIGAPPPVIVQSPPTMVFLTEPGVYVATGVSHDIFFIGGRYYYFHGDRWFWGSAYDGPWVFVVHENLPPGLRKYKVTQLRTYRDREYAVYKVQGKNFKGKQFVGVSAQDNDKSNRGKGRKK